MMSVAIVAMAFAGCSKDATEVTTPTAKGVKVQFKAEVIDETRATLTPNDGETEFKAAWENSDKIGLHIDSKNYNEEITNSYDDVLGVRTNGAFEAQFDTKPGTAFWWDYYAYYPYNADNSYGNYQAHIPFGGERVQYGNNYNSAYDIMVSSGISASTLEEGSNIEVGVDENGDAIVLPMKRMTAIAYFHFTTTKEAQADKVLSVTISATPANESEPLASDQAYVHYGDKDSQCVMMGGTAVNTIKITYDTATAPTAADFKAWFNVLPGTFSSLTLDIETENYTAQISRKSAATYAAGQLYKTIFNLDSKWVKKDGGDSGKTASDGDILWSENWDGCKANSQPTANGDGTKVFNNGVISYTYSVTATKIYNEKLAGGTAPELLLSKTSGKWTISGIPTGNCSIATLQFGSNNDYAVVTTTTKGVNVSAVSGATRTYEITFDNVETFDLVFTNNNSSSNTRIDDIILAAGKIKGVLDKPVITTAINKYDLTVSWDAVKNADRYVVECGNDLEQTVIGATSCTFKDLAPKEYTVTVTAESDNGYASSERTATVTIQDYNIANPTITSTSLTTTELKASWTAVANASGYEWYLTENGKDEILLGKTTTTETNITATGTFTEDTEYVLYVKSVAKGDYDAPEGYAEKAITCTAVASTTKTYTLTFPDDNKTDNGVTSYATTWTAKKGDNSWSIANFNNNKWNNSWTYIKCGSKSAASVATITTGWAIAEAIKKVTLTIDKITSASVNSIKLYVSSDSTFADADIIDTIDIDKSTGDKVCTIKTPTANCYYKIEFDCAKGSSNGLVQVSKVVYTNAE